MVDLLLQQPYLAGVIADPRWSLTPPDDWKAPELPQQYDRVYHLGYRGWPALPLPYATLRVAQEVEELAGISVDLKRPWITVKDGDCENDIACGFTEAWFELKLGLCLAVDNLLPDYWLTQLTPCGTRWTSEGNLIDQAFTVEGSDWVLAAQYIRDCRVFLGDCSALHVLAVALGKPCVIVEPMEARWDPIFWPLGMDGPQVRCVKGNDVQPTFDARHTADVLREVLRGR